MDPEIARTVVIAIAAVLAAVWLAALQSMILAARAMGSRAREAAERFGIDEPAAAGTFVGEIEVDGSPEELSRKLGAVLARGAYGPLGTVQIVSCDAREVAFEAAGTATAASPLRRGRFRLSPAGRRTRIEYALDASPGRALLALGWTFVALGLAGLVAVAWAQFQFVLPSPNPQTRWQSLQTLQAVHFIWPPFLFAHLSRRIDRQVRAGIEALVGNLPYA